MEWIEKIQHFVPLFLGSLLDVILLCTQKPEHSSTYGVSECQFPSVTFGLKERCAFNKLCSTWRSCSEFVLCFEWSSFPVASELFLFSRKLLSSSGQGWKGCTHHSTLQQSINYGLLCDEQVKIISIQQMPGIINISLYM